MEIYETVIIVVVLFIIFVLAYYAFSKENKNKLSGTLLTEEQSYEIAKKFCKYCYAKEDDSLAIGSKAIPLIFDECLKFLNNK